LIVGENCMNVPYNFIQDASIIIKIKTIKEENKLRKL